MIIRIIIIIIIVILIMIIIIIIMEISWVINNSKTSKIINNKNEE